jgi:hypothetical protein
MPDQSRECQEDIQREAIAFVERHGGRWQHELLAILVEVAVSTDREEAMRWFGIAAALQEYRADGTPEVATRHDRSTITCLI